MSQLEVPIYVSLDKIRETFEDHIFHIDEEELLDFIMAIDLAQARYEFTLELIRRLVASLKEGEGDEPLTAEEIGL